VWLNKYNNESIYYILIKSIIRRDSRLITFTYIIIFYIYNVFKLIQTTVGIVKKITLFVI